MALLLNNGALFLHVPKTGGSWIARVLSEGGLVRRQVSEMHADYYRSVEGLHWVAGLARRTVREVKNQLPLHLRWRLKEQAADHEGISAANLGNGAGWKPPFTFCFVRHPLSWYESWYRFMEKEGWRTWGKDGDWRDWHPNSVLNGLRPLDFHDFVRQAIERRPGLVSELYALYTPGSIGFVGKQENLVEDLIRVLQIMGLPFDEEKVRNRRKENVSHSPATPIAWDPVLRKETLLLEAPALRRFGYSDSP